MLFTFQILKFSFYGINAEIKNYLMEQLSKDVPIQINNNNVT